MGALPTTTLTAPSTKEQADKRRSPPQVRKKGPGIAAPGASPTETLFTRRRTPRPSVGALGAGAPGA